MFHRFTKGHCTLPLFPCRYRLRLKAQNIRGGVVVPLSQIPTCAEFHLRTSLSAVVSGTDSFWLGSTWRANKEERSGGHTVKSQNTSSKPLSSCAIISCSFFFPPSFLLQINSRERFETPQLTMRGGRKIPAAG